MVWLMRSPDGDGGDGGSGGDEEHVGSIKAVKWRRSASNRWTATAMLLLFLITGSAAVLSNSTFKGEQQSDINARIGQSAFLPCELEPNNVTMGFEVTTQCGIVHSVKWYRGASRIFLYSGGPRVVQPHREGYTDRYDRSYWSIEPNSTLGFLVMDNITALDEAVYKCEITYTKVHEGCNIVQFINLTTYTDPESISVGILAEPGDPSKHNYIDPTSDFYDDKNSNPKFGVMKKLTSGTAVGPVDEGNRIRLVCRAGRARPVPQVTWWQHNRGPIDDDDLIDYQYRKVDSDMSDDYFSYSGLWVAQSVLTVVGRRGANGKYECRVKTATDSSPVLTSNVDVTVNVSPFSVEMSTSSSGSTVTTVSKVDERPHKPQKGEHGRDAGEVVYAETTEGQPLVIRCAARGARPQANVTWYYYYKDQENDNDDSGGGTRNDPDVRASTPVQPARLSKHGAPVMLGNSHQNGSSTARSPSDYLISEQRRVEGGAEIIGPVEIAQHTEYQADGTRDTHSQLSMSQLHRQQDGSILRCDAYNNVGSSPSQPLTVNMTIRVKYVPTAWVVPVTDADNSGAVIEDETKNEIGPRQHGGADVNGATDANDAPKTSDDGFRYQTNLYTVVVNETRELRLQCAYHANPDKLRTPVKWYRDGVELQLTDEDEQSSAGYRSENAPVNSRFRVNAVGNAAKHARVKQSTNGNGDGNGADATVLLVRRLTRFDSGRYECRVRNSVGAANSTNFANVRVQYTPKVKLHVILDDAFDEDQTPPPTTTTTMTSNAAAGSNPIVLESQHRNVTLRCAVRLEPDQQNVDDDPSLNLTSVHWYWNGVQMQLPNCTRSSDASDVFEDEDDVDGGDTDAPSDSENNGMNVNYYTSETHGDEDYDTYAVDNDTARRRNKKQRKVLCTDRELILINVTKNIHGNYSCRARNAAGLLTPMSDQTPLIVYFAPGPVTLEFSPRQVIKGKNVTLRCNAQYLGRPQHPTRYSWFRDGHQIYHQNQILTNPNGNNGGGNFNPEWFVDHVSLETRANFTCSAYNEGGVTYSEPVYIEVFAPPNYIIGPPQYLGVVYNATHVNASCTVECYPHCSVYWLRRGVQIDPINNPTDKQGYSILTEYLPAERLKNDFEAVRSTLIWRMENNWPRGLDPVTDSTEYSCRSSGNDVGPPVSESIMNFSVEYPPGNMTVSKTAIHVSEGNIPEKVFCHAEGRPQPTFEWRYIGSANNWIVPGNSSQPTQPSSQQKILSVANSGNGGGVGGNVGGGSGSGNSQINNQQLVLNSAVSRQQAGYYACVARNMHGNGTAHTYLDVMYKPSCQLRMLTVDQLKQETSSVTAGQSSESGATAELDEFLSSSAGEKRILVCTATANPGHVQYTWTVRNSGRVNDTSAASSSTTSDSPAAERIITVAIGGSSANGWSMETDNGGFLNRSVLILQDTLEVSSSEEGDGRDNDNVPNKGEGVRTYVCTVNNTVGWDQCTIQVQGDAPWWKQLLTSVGLGGLPITVVLVALVVILLLIIVVVVVLLLMFVCKNRYIKPGNGMTGRRQKYSRGGAEQQDNESNAGAAADSKAAFYENLPFHGMRPPPNQVSVARRAEATRHVVAVLSLFHAYRFVFCFWLCFAPFFSRAMILSGPPSSTRTVEYAAQPSVSTADEPPSSSSPRPRATIRKSPDGGYVSLLRRAGPAASVRFDSSRRPDRGTTVFRSMRTAAAAADTSDANDARRRPSRSSSSAAVVAAGPRDGDASAATFPKPAPRTRIPPPLLARRRDVYENLQQLLNGNDVQKKLTGVGIGARSLDEFYRMQIQQQQQQQSLYQRVMADDASSTVLAAGYPTGGEPHRGQQSIEMTQFEVTADPSSCQKPQNPVVGRYNNNNNNNNSNCIVTTERDRGDDDDDYDYDYDDEARSKSMTVDRRRRASRQALDGGGGASLTEHYFNVITAPYQQRHRGGRRGDDGNPPPPPPPQPSVRPANSYNTIAGGGGRYYAGPGARQQHAKRPPPPPQRSRCGDDATAADEPDPTAKRSWARRPQNRRRRAGEPAGCGDPDAAEPRAPSPADAARPHDHRHHHRGGGGGGGRPRQPPNDDYRGADQPNAVQTGGGERLRGKR